MPNAKRRCRNCKTYKPAESMMIINGGAYCDCNCAWQWSSEKSIQAAEKATRKQMRERKAALKTKPEHTKTAQAAFNRYINQRDYNRPCISCGRPLRHGARNAGEKGGVDASHYRSRGAAPHMRFHTGNCHSSCVYCNRDLSGNIVEYRKGLIARYGVEMVERIEADQRPRKYSIDDLKRIAKIFNRRARHYKRLREAREQWTQ